MTTQITERVDDFGRGTKWHGDFSVGSTVTLSLEEVWTGPAYQEELVSPAMRIRGTVVDRQTVQPQAADMQPSQGVSRVTDYVIEISDEDASRLATRRAAVDEAGLDPAQVQ